METFKRKTNGRQLKDRIQKNFELIQSISRLGDSIGFTFHNPTHRSIYVDLYVNHTVETYKELSKKYSITNIDVIKELRRMHNLSTKTIDDVIKQFLSISPVKQIPSDIDGLIKDYIDDVQTLSYVVGELYYMKTLLSNVQFTKSLSTYFINTSTHIDYYMIDSYNNNYNFQNTNIFNTKLYNNIAKRFKDLISDSEIVRVGYLGYFNGMQMLVRQGIRTCIPVISIELWKQKNLRIMFYQSNKGKLILSVDTTHEINIPDFNDIHTNISDWNEVKLHDKSSINMKNFIYDDYQNSKTRFTFILDDMDKIEYIISSVLRYVKRTYDKIDIQHI